MVSMKFINPRALSSTLALLVCYSPEPLNLIDTVVPVSNYYIYIYIMYINIHTCYYYYQCMYVSMYTSLYM